MITYAKSTRRDHRARVSPPEVLRSPHLVLAHPSRNDDFILLVSRLAIQLLNDLLRLRARSIVALYVRKRIFLFPLGKLCEPVCARVGGLDERDEGGEVGDDVPEYGYGCFDDFVDVLGLDLEMDYPSLALKGCFPCRRRKGFRERVIRDRAPTLLKY